MCKHNEVKLQNTGHKVDKTAHGADCHWSLDYQLTSTLVFCILSFMCLCECMCNTLQQYCRINTGKLPSHCKWWAVAHFYHPWFDNENYSVNAFPRRSSSMVHYCTGSCQSSKFNLPQLDRSHKVGSSDKDVLHVFYNQDMVRMECSCINCIGNKVE